jgi:hypothetical protein
MGEAGDNIARDGRPHSGTKFEDFAQKRTAHSQDTGSVSAESRYLNEELFYTH